MKALILCIVLASAAISAWGQSAAPGTDSSAALSASQTEAETQRRIRQQELRSLLRHCRTMAEVARGHAGELLASTTHGRANLEVMQPHLREVRWAVESMFGDHKRVLYGLTEEQWTAAKDPITALEKIRIGIQTQLEGIDLELQMPTPDAKVLARYGKKIKSLLEDWRKQHCKMAAAIGLEL